MQADAARRTDLVWPDVAWAAAIALASLLSILFFDKTASTWAHATFHGDTVFVDLTHIVDPVLPLAALGFLGMGIAALCGWRPGPLAFSLLCACMAVLIAVTVKDQLKYAFGRLWPETWVAGNPSWIKDQAYGFFPFHGGAGWSSFPSGHMTVITAPMAVFWRRYPALRIIWWIPVAAVAVGLYGADYHFVGDMMAGLLVGALCARCVLALPLERPARDTAPL